MAPPLAPVGRSPRFSFPLATALRETFARGYDLGSLRADVLAGFVVGVVALPLSMALAIGVGAPPQHGLYTAAVAGAVVASLGGCRFQVTGPTAAFIVILAPILHTHGLAGLLTAGFLSGIILVIMGISGMGTLIRFIPYPVTTGFTTGIAVVIATLQLKDAFGLKVPSNPEHYHEKVLTLWAARGSWSPAELLVAAGTLALLLALPRVIQKIPAPLLAISAASIAVALMQQAFPTLEFATVGSRFHTMVNDVDISGIPPILPSPALPGGTRSPFP